MTTEEDFKATLPPAEPKAEPPEAKPKPKKRKARKSAKTSHDGRYRVITQIKYMCHTKQVARYASKGDELAVGVDLNQAAIDDFYAKGCIEPLFE